MKEWNFLIKIFILINKLFLNYYKHFSFLIHSLFLISKSYILKLLDAKKKK